MSQPLSTTTRHGKPGSPNTSARRAFASTTASAISSSSIFRKPARILPKQPMRSCMRAGSRFAGVANYGLPQCLRLTIGSEDANRRVAQRSANSWRAAYDDRFQARVREGGADRHRPDRLLHGACHASAAGLPRILQAMRTGAETLEKAGASVLRTRCMIRWRRPCATPILSCWQHLSAPSDRSRKRWRGF